MLKLKKLDFEITRCSTFFTNNKGHVIREWKISKDDFPIKLYAVPYEDEIEELIKDVQLINDLPF